MADLVDNNGGTVTDNLAKAELMNDYFSSVFTVVDTNNLPVLGDKADTAVYMRHFAPFSCQPSQRPESH